MRVIKKTARGSFSRNKSKAACLGAQGQLEAGVPMQMGAAGKHHAPTAPRLPNSLPSHTCEWQDARDLGADIFAG